MALAMTKHKGDGNVTAQALRRTPERPPLSAVRNSRRPTDRRLDPTKLAKLSAPERGAIYRECGLDLGARFALEQEVRSQIATRYGRKAPR